MTHTQTVQLLIDMTRSTGVGYHTLTPAERAAVKEAGRYYMLLHASAEVDRRERLDEAKFRILAELGR